MAEERSRWLANRVALVEGLVPFPPLDRFASARALVIVTNADSVEEPEFSPDELRTYPVPVIIAAGGSGIVALHVALAADIFIAGPAVCFRSEAGEMTAEEALGQRAVTRVEEDPARAAIEIAESIGRLAPLAVRAAKRAVRFGKDLEITEALELENELFSGLFATADMREGTRAFFEKRRPDFSGE